MRTGGKDDLAEGGLAYESAPSGWWLGWGNKRRASQKVREERSSVGKWGI